MSEIVYIHRVARASRRHSSIAVSLSDSTAEPLSFALGLGSLEQSARPRVMYAGY